MERPGWLSPADCGRVRCQAEFVRVQLRWSRDRELPEIRILALGVGGGVLGPSECAGHSSCRCGLDTGPALGIAAAVSQDSHQLLPGPLPWQRLLALRHCGILGRSLAG